MERGEALGEKERPRVCQHLRHHRSSTHVRLLLRVLVQDASHSISRADLNGHGSTDWRVVCLLVA
jgi:hypothetical protein